MRTSYRFQTIRQVLMVGFSFLIFLLISAGAVGWFSMRRMADEVTKTLAGAQQDARQASEFSNVVTQEIQAANTYLAIRTPDRMRISGHSAGKRTGCTGTLHPARTPSPSRSSGP
jgi:hypothetical protein